MARAGSGGPRGRPSPLRRARRGLPRPPAPSPMAMADRGRHRSGSGPCSTPAGCAGPLSPPSPLSHGDLTGGGVRSEVAAAPPGRARGGRPHPPAPSPIAMGEGEKLIWGRAKPSPGPPGCRGAAASRRRPHPVSRGDGRGGGLGPPPHPRVVATRPLPDGHLPRSDGEGRGGETCLGGAKSPQGPRIAAARHLPDEDPGGIPPCQPRRRGGRRRRGAGSGERLAAVVRW